jgi:uncharacterized OB-fold protein
MAPPADRDSAWWWAQLAAQRLMLQRCAQCGMLRWPPRAMCGVCGAFGTDEVEASGRGQVASWIVTHRAFLPDLRPPYVVLLVRLADQEDLLLPGGWDGPPDGAGLRVGLEVRVGFTDAAPDLTLLRWRPAGEERP